MTLIVASPRSYIPERRYILDLIFGEWLGLDYELDVQERQDVSVRRRGDDAGVQLTMPDRLFATPEQDWLTEASLPALPLARLPMTAPAPLPSGEEWVTAPDRPLVPVLFGAPREERLWTPTPPGLSLNIDVPGSAFFMLTRYEEVARPFRDNHGRFPGAASLAGAEGILERPIVDEYVDLLWAGLASLWPGLERRRSVFRLRLTHDVDQPLAAVGQSPGAIIHALGGDLLRRRDPDLAIRRARSAIDALTGRTDRDPLNTFDLLMETSEQFGLRSTFYFLAGNERGDADFRYRLSDPWFIDLLSRIHERGHEVGLHASYASHLTRSRTEAEFAALRQACESAGFEQPSWGVRQHYLRLEVPQTWRIHEAAGFEHDSSLGFADRVGFRAGTCREFPLFDVGERRRLRLRERPLVVMDATMFTYLELTNRQATRTAVSVVAACRRHAGDAVLLYHNDVLAARARQRHYRTLVAQLATDADVTSIPGPGSFLLRPRNETDRGR